MPEVLRVSQEVDERILKEGKGQIEGHIDARLARMLADELQRRGCVKVTAERRSQPWCDSVIFTGQVSVLRDDEATRPRLSGRQADMIVLDDHPVPPLLPKPDDRFDRMRDFMARLKSVMVPDTSGPFVFDLIERAMDEIEDK